VLAATRRYDGVYRTEEVLSVSDAAEDLAEARHRAAAVRRERRRLMRAASPISFSLGPGHSVLVDPDIAKDAWSAIQHWQRGIPGAGEVLREKISSGSPHLRIAIFQYLWTRIPARGFRGRDLADVVIANLDNPDRGVARFAAILCTSKHIPGAGERALTLLAGPAPSVDRGELAAITLQLPRPAEAMAAIDRALEHETDPRTRGTLESALRSFLVDRDATIAARALAYLTAHLDQAGEPATRPSFALSVGRVAEATRLPDRAKAIDALFDLLDSDDPHTPQRAVIGLGTVAKGTRDDRLCERLLAHRVAATQSSSVRATLLHVRGAVADRVLLAQLGTLTPQYAAEVIWALEGWTLRDVLRRCRDAGLIARVPEQTLIDRIWYHHCGQWDDSTFSLLQPFIRLMARQGGAVHYVVDTDMIPAGHARVIRRFMRCTHPWLRPGALTEVIDHAGDERIGYTVQFIANRRRYRLELPYSGTRVYPRHILMTMNDVLRDAGREERFVHLFDEEQQMFLFGIPDTVRDVARELYLPFAHDRELAKEAVADYRRSRRART